MLTFKHLPECTFLTYLRPRFMEAYPLLVIFHDPPEVMNVPDPVTGKLELHNTWLVCSFTLQLYIR